MHIPSEHRGAFPKLCPLVTMRRSIARYNGHFLLDQEAEVRLDMGFINQVPGAGTTTTLKQK